MTNKNKATGTSWEVKCREFLRPVFPDVERSPLMGKLDKGDLLATGPFTVECKAEKTIRLSAYLREAQVEADNAGKKYPVVFVKRRNHRTDQGYAVMEMAKFRELMKEVTASK